MRDAKPDRLIRVLKGYGFTEAGGTKHRLLTKVIEGKKVTVGIPFHGIIKRNTVDALRKQAGIDKKEFYSHKF